MRDTYEISVNKRQMQKRLAAVALLLCLFAVSVLSEALVMVRAGHEHDHNGADGGCATCAQIQYAENVMRQLGIAAGVALPVFAVAVAAASLGGAVCLPVAFHTLTGLKIRMNN